jgi:release factor glutamine methyltransferase
MSKVWRIIDIIQWAKKYFNEKEFDNPRREIEWLLCSLFNCKRIDIYIRFEEPLTKPQLKILKEWIKRRLNYEPLQYITNNSNFYGRDFYVNHHVLIPRPETERLIDLSIDKLTHLKNPKILEVGSGSGCISLTLGLEIENAQILAVDICSKAIKVANKNKIKYDVSNVTFKEMDIIKNKPVGMFDLFISNPPYIGEEKVKTLMKDVKDYEPLKALTDYEDGYKFYRRFAEIVPSLVRNRGYIILEVGNGDHPKKVSEIFSNLGYLNLLEKDFNGDERILIIKMNK